MADPNSDPIQVTGLVELRASMREVGNGAPKEMQKALKGIAAKVARIVSSKVPAREGKAASSYKPRATQTAAGIAFGGNAAPYTPWLEFGGTVGKGHKPGVAFSGSVKRTWAGRPAGDGRYLYPTISEEREETAQAVLDVTAQLAERHGLDIRNG